MKIHLAAVIFSEGQAQIFETASSRQAPFMWMRNLFCVIVCSLDLFSFE